MFVRGSVLRCGTAGFFGSFSKDLASNLFLRALDWSLWRTRGFVMLSMSINYRLMNKSSGPIVMIVLLCSPAQSEFM